MLTDYIGRIKLTRYGKQTAEQFRETIADRGVVVRRECSSPQFEPNGIFVSPKTNNRYYEYSSGSAKGIRYEQFITGYYPDLPLKSETFAAVFVIELPSPALPLYIASRTALTFNAIMGWRELPVLNGIEKVRLDSDFSEFFSVYSRDNRALDAFMIMAPDIMLDILTSGSGYDIEFAGRNVYIYRNYALYQSQSASSKEPIGSIKLSSDDYLAMRDFGIKYAEEFIRAAQPSRSEDRSDTLPLWQVARSRMVANAAQQFLWLAVILGYMFSVIVLTYYWFILTAVLFAVRLALWFARRRRLIARWARTTPDSPQR